MKRIAKYWLEILTAAAISMFIVWAAMLPDDKPRTYQPRPEIAHVPSTVIPTTVPRMVVIDKAGKEIGEVVIKLHP